MVSHQHNVCVMLASLLLYSYYSIITSRLHTIPSISQLSISLCYICPIYSYRIHASGKMTLSDLRCSGAVFTCKVIRVIRVWRERCIYSMVLSYSDTDVLRHVVRACGAGCGACVAVLVVMVQPLLLYQPLLLQPTTSSTRVAVYPAVVNVRTD